MKKYLKIMLNTAIPIIIGIVSFVIYFKTRSTSLNDLGYYAASATFFISIVISWWFNRSRVFFSIIALSIIYISQGILFQIDDLSNTYKSIMIFSLFFLPINFTMFAFFKERGILTLWGILKFLLLFIQTFFFYWWCRVEGKDFSILSKTSLSPLEIPIYKLLLEPITLIIIASFFVLILLAFRRKAALDIGFISVTIVSLTMVILGKDSNGRMIFYTAAGLILIFAVLQDSYNMAFLDELTTLHGRRALRNEMMKLSGRYTVAMLDIDFFKKFNDTYGHDVGDQVLKMVADVMKTVEGGGKPFRYGGEEFTVIFHGKTMAESIPYLEQLRKNIESSPFYKNSKKINKKGLKSSKKSASGKPLYVTISIGVAEKSEKYKKVEDVLKASDNALYRAKKKGRNCVSK